MRVDYTILEDYKDTQFEIEQLRRLIAKRRTQAARLRKMKVTDTVSGGAGGRQHFKIEGVPDGNIAVQEAYIAKSEYLLQCKLDKLIELTYQTEEFITQIPNSRLRRIGMYRIMEGLTWEEVADRMSEDGNDIQAQSLRVYWKAFLDRCKEQDEFEDLTTGGNRDDMYTYGNA